MVDKALLSLLVWGKARATYRGVAKWVSTVVGRKLSFKSIARQVVMTKLANADGISTHDAAKHVGVVPQTLAVYHQKGKKVKTQAAMLLSRYNVENPKDENEIKASRGLRQEDLSNDTFHASEQIVLTSHRGFTR